ncbi:MAG: transposase [Candidatus Marinimicrobia bacterium]|nr:transposase [Candidatus Neomarinimicrobiota bacterium]
MNHGNIFGKIVNKKMTLNEYGEISQKCRHDLPIHINYCYLREYVIMPDHIHGIIEIKHSKDVLDSKMLNFKKIPRHQGLPNIIRSFKSASSRLIHQAGFENFQWQKSYYDIIIKSHHELIQYVKYINNNPINWKK